MLRLYREALRWRRALQADETLEWSGDATGDVVHFGRSNGWQCVVNFGGSPVDLPEGRVLLASMALDGQRLPGAAAAWVMRS